jgi:hypothetical protein
MDSTKIDGYQCFSTIAKDKLHEHHQDLLGRERAANEAA